MLSIDLGAAREIGVTIPPEPETLTLFGSGLIALGLLAKFGRSRKPISSTSVDW
jgi:hypothetical protein